MIFYSQNDPRWAAKKLGKSKYTVGTSGCLVTAVQNQLLRDGFHTDPGLFTDWANLNHGFEDPLGYLVFGSIARYSKRYQLVDRDATNKLNTIHQVMWTLRNGTRTTHWVAQDKGRDIFLAPYVIDSWDGKRKSLRQPFWKITGRRAYIKLA